MDKSLNNITPTAPEFLADYEIGHTEEELENLDWQLSELEKAQMKELRDMRNEGQVRGTLFRDILEAAKDGALKYIDSFTDVHDGMSELKNSDEVRQWNDTEIDKRNKPATPTDDWQTRTMSEANRDPFDKNVEGDISGMSPQGQKKFKTYQTAYRNRTKSLTHLSKEGNTVNRSDSATNYESLSGLRCYRVGPVIPNAYSTVSEAKGAYDSYCESMRASGRENSIKSQSSWLFDENSRCFDEQLMKEFGFKTRSEATRFRKENHLTIHEGPDGMFLVPTDVHDAVSHNGYRSKMAEAMRGDCTQEDVDRFAIEERIAVVKHEAKQRSVRAAKGIGMGIVKDLLKNVIFISIEETYIEFSKERKDKFVNRIRGLLHTIWQKLKNKCLETINKLWETIKNGVVGAIVSEFFTLLSDFVFKTAKNIFRILRTMWSSIYNAFKVIFSKNTSWKDKVYEASKIIVSGFVGVVGFSLNEIIEKFLVSISIPLSIASFVSECISGLFAGIMSSLVLMIFDKIKERLQKRNQLSQQSVTQQRLVLIDCARIEISSLQLSYKMRDTFNLFGTVIDDINSSREMISRTQKQGDLALEDIDTELDRQAVIVADLNYLKNKYANDNDF